MQYNDGYSMSLFEWETLLEGLGEKKYRAGQIFSWLHKDRVTTYEAMTNLSKSLRKTLEETVPLRGTQAVCEQRSADGETRKFLMELWDREQIETVLMRYHYGYSLCISSQVGCRMGCRFCASTLSGKKRDLLPGEMLSQIYEAERKTGCTVTHVVIMGCGEPFDNYEALLRFLELVNAPQGKNLSLRNITVSTCGLVERIRDFAALDLGVTLAVSLHAPNDTIRRRLMPVANAVPMATLMEACRDYTRRTRRRITFEYSLVRDVNDGPEQAEELADLLHGMLAHVNLIPVNPVTEREFRGSEPERVDRFRSILERRKIEVTVRREMGRDIDAACGQLRRRFEGEKLPE